MRMRLHTKYRLLQVLVLLLLAVLPAGPGGAQDVPDDAVRLSMPAFGDEVQIEVRGLSEARARTAIRAALLEIHEFAMLADQGSAQSDSLAAVNRHPGEKVAVDRRIFEFLLHGMRFCLWSNGEYGPLGGRIYDLWEARLDGRDFDPMDLRDAVASADCANLELREGPPPNALVRKGSLLDGRGLERGFALDLAADVLRGHGVENAILETPRLIRAFGPGSDGRGWLVILPGVHGTRSPLDQLYLRDQSLAWQVMPETGSREVRLVRQRTGVPGQGVVMVATVTPLAADAQALATTLYVMGRGRGQRHLGALNPRPSVLWLLGTGTGTPLESPYRWSEVESAR